MRLNLWLIRTSQFLQQFKLDVRHKPGKEHIIPDALSRLANVNTDTAESSYSKLNALFLYITTLVEIHLTLVSRIIARYKADAWWSRLHTPVQANNNLSADRALFLFVLGSTPPTDADLYLAPRLKGEPKVLPIPKISRSLEKPPQPNNMDDLPPSDKTQLLYYVNKMAGVHCWCIPLPVAPDILVIAHGKVHPGFSRCY